jgi:hypothetical protein
MDTAFQSEAEAFDAQSKASALRRAQEERERAQREREEHLATIARESEDRKTELELLMEALKEPVRQQIRLHAYLHALNDDWGLSNNVQAKVDEIALRLARYVTEGKV